jgi:hypothetical protein
MFGPLLLDNSAAAGRICALERFGAETGGEKADIFAGL